MKTSTTFLDKILQNRSISHTLFWLTLLGTTTFLTSLNLGLFRHHLINNLALLPAQMAAAYFLCYYQLPRQIFKKKYLSFVASLLVSAFVFSVLARLAIIYIAEPFIRTDFEEETVLEVLSDPYYLLTVYVPVVYSFPLIMFVIKIVKGRQKEKNELTVLQKEKATTELNFLKAQIHPHFLFNTLNNLYSLTIDKSDLAPEVVIKLSEILDYMIYECADPKVSVSKVQTLIQHYIDLEKLRYGEQLDLVFDCDIDDPTTEIAPLILLPLVENAFKHGASKDLDAPKVHISLEVQKEALHFTIFNTKSVLVAQKETDKKGIGSSNIKRRLDLIYPNAHTLKIDDKVDSYFVALDIHL
ncbi:histidine kinase [Flavobacteriaceae bacterium S356]|uniref:Histidine kinase n=1 Tax=Asprobacillus argus TaxID=3076534 RepID=A0ABU3LEQ8_9FLAO|nr:histidine kinase [Flavobacteriaceae bacterium S356]